MKRWILEAHDFYVTQISKRVFAQIQDLEGDAN